MRGNLDIKMRLFRINQMLKEQGVVSLEQFQEQLKCSEPTIKRDISYMRHKLNAPIEYDYNRRGYVYNLDKMQEAKDSGELKEAEFDPCELPNRWYSPTELYVYMTALGMLNTLEELKDGLLCRNMSMLRTNMLSMLEGTREQIKELQKRIKVVQPPMRLYRNSFFEMIGCALVTRKRLRIMYFTRKDQLEKDREISPLRMVNYRNCWYLDAYCHRTKSLRTFNLDYIRHVVILTRNCEAVAMRDIEEQLDCSYGMFSGGELQTAEIRLDREVAAFVRHEMWHKDQVLTRLPDGSYMLKVPFANPTELTGQILRLGQHAKVEAPESLRRYVVDVLTQTRALYHDNAQ